MERVISKDSTVITYQKSGNGPPLLVVHGTTADYSRWKNIIPTLEKHYTVYAMNRRGRGGSGDSPEYSIWKEAEDVAAIIKKIDEPIYLLGHSYGAVCALESSLLTKNIKRMILYEPPIPTGIRQYPEGVPDEIQKLTDQGELEKGLELFFRKVVKMPEYEFNKYSKLPMWKERIKLAPTIAREMRLDQYYVFEPSKFQDLNIPILLLLGEDSPPLFKDAIKMINKAIPTSRIKILDHQQHVAMDMDPDLFISEVMNFLND